MHFTKDQGDLPTKRGAEQTRNLRRTMLLDKTQISILCRVIVALVTRGGEAELEFQCPVPVVG